MRYFFLLALFLQQFSALAQLDTLRSKSGIETYLRDRYHYKSVILHAINLVIKDTISMQPANPAYWLKADFNHDGKADLFISATVEKRRQGNQDILCILASEGKHYTRVDIADPIGYIHSGETSYSTYTYQNKSYLAITNLIQDFQKPQNMRNGHPFVYSNTHDTLFINNYKPILYSKHPAQQLIESVEFSATACFGTCPVFKLTINKNGLVNYKGIQYVDRMGDFELKMSHAEFAHLTSLLAAIKPLCLDNKYRTETIDLPTVYLIVRYTNGQVKSIEDYGEQGTYGLAILYSFLLNLRNF